MSNDDLDRTVIMPTPGRGRGQGQQTPAGGETPSPEAITPPPQSPQSPPPVAPPGAAATTATNQQGVSLHMVGSSGQNVLVNAATMIFSLARQLRNTPEHADVNGLLQHVTGLMQTYEKNCINLGIGPDVAYEARYVLCAFLDEIVLNTPWGSGSTWSHHGLLSTLHGDTTGGERFFQILARKSDTPGQNLPLLELMYHCLRLGFQGKFAIQEGGSHALEQISNGLYQTIRGLRGDPEPELSPHWQGVTDGRPAVARLVPWWVVGAVLGGILVVTFAGFFFALNEQSDQAFADIGKLGREVPQMVKSRQQVAPLVDPVLTGVDLTQVNQRLNDFLAEEIANRQVSLLQQPTDLKVTLHNQGLFASGSAVVAESYRMTINRLASALSDLPGPIIVSGHSDSQQIRTLRYPSNWHLSDERARAIVAMLVESGMQRDRLVAQGKADTEPVASNETAAGRQQNRRIEILIRSF